MLPLTLAMMAGTAATSFLGAQEANNVARQNAQISMLNYYEQRRARRLAEQEARRQQEEAKLGTTDAAGNRTRFVPGVGWVTELTPEQQALQNATEREQLEAIDRQGVVSERAADRQTREDVLATEAERELRAARRPDENALRQLLLARGAETRNRAADRAGNMVARQNVRAGGRNAAELLQGARAASDAVNARQAGIDAQLGARDMAGRQFAQDRDSARTMYDYFRRASTAGVAPVNGVTPTGPATRSSGVADQGLLNIMGRRAPELDYQNTNTAFTDAAQGLINMFGSYKGMRDTNTQADRIRNNQGSWQGIVN